MCGIAGEFRWDGDAVELGVVERMMRTLERRGPDSGGTYFHGPVGFGHRRLSIIDLSPLSNQPMHDAKLGLTIVFNGTIYNYRVLRQELLQKGYEFFSNGDTETILKAYAEWGEACPEKLHGMFAFAIWDNNKKQLFMARDRMGIKPFYYSLNAHYIRFASSSQALLAAGDVDKRIDPVGLHHQFTLHAVIPAPVTILRGIRKVRPAHSMTIDANGRIRERCYWNLTAQRPAQQRSEQEWQALIHDALRDAVRKRLEIADVPVGVLLSGGLDSSLLVALLAESGVKDLRTFSIGFEDVGEERGSEFEYSDQVVARYQTRHTKIAIPNEEVLRRLPEAVDNMTEPMVGQDAVAFYLLAERVSKHVKVVQSGQGADEVFAGYFWYPRMHADTEIDEVQRFAKYYFDRPHDEFLQMVTPMYRGADVTSKKIGELLAMPGADTFLDKVLRMDVTTLIVDDPVKRVDNMTMAWGLEARVPFLDHHLVELAMQMPPELKLRDEGKYMLKQIARPLLPVGVIDRPKGYFPLPALKYVRGEFLQFMRDILDSNACRSRGLYEHAYVAQCLAKPESYLTKLNGSKLWHLALLELWLQRNVDSFP